jgi:hypothetical protein
MRIVTFYDERLPFDGARPDEASLRHIAGFSDILGLDGLTGGALEGCGAIISLHGKYVPPVIWNGLCGKLREGCGYVGIGGGTPFSAPVSLENGKAVCHRRQTAYHQELNICHGQKIGKERYGLLRINRDIPLLEGFEGCFEPADTVGLIVRFTRFLDTEKELGSSGPMDAQLYPLLMGYDADGRQRAAPVVMIENFIGDYAGGRWIFVNTDPTEKFWNAGGARLAETLAGYAAAGACEFSVRPNYASYYPGEQPELLVSAADHSGRALALEMDVRIEKDGKPVFTKDVRSTLSGESVLLTIPCGFPAEPGVYDIAATARLPGQPARTVRNGFWGYDRALLEGGDEISCGRDYFLKGGKPMPVVGMTYMQSDVHRKFIHLPNVHLWDKDMAEMARAGINMVRTGVWTGTRSIAPDDGVVREEYLRVFDAMFLTAKKHGIAVVFTFFAFTPDAWEGLNPYLDPRATRAQKRFIASFARRHAKSRGVSWDLINEPSVCAMRTAWAPKPNYDAYELRAWREWLHGRYGRIENLWERWNCTPAEVPCFSSAALPNEEDMEQRPTFVRLRKAMRAMDYALFTQHVLNLWAGQMVDAIRRTGSAQMVTIGQDEALGAKRPSPFFHGEHLDYTTCHSWWLNDDLYWDGIFSKTGGKPCLIQETGIMHLVRPDGAPRRDEFELRDILERKYALAFAANNAGAIHWLWNINIYMESMNEVNIGAIRADGSQKAEADVSYDFGAFIREVSPLFEDREPETVSIVFPNANCFSVRDHATPATKRAARILGYDLGVPFKCFGEYRLGGLGADKLIILPGGASLEDETFNLLMERVKQGSVLLLSGVFSRDAYWHANVERARLLGLKTEIRTVKREECLYLGETPVRVAFEGNKYEWVDKESVVGAARDELRVIPLGRGMVVWSPLPVELSDDAAAAVELYRKALEAAGVVPPFTVRCGVSAGVLVKRLAFARGSVYIAVSENASDARVGIRHSSAGRDYCFTLPAGRAVLFAVDGRGDVTASYRDAPITVEQSDSQGNLVLR